MLATAALAAIPVLTMVALLVAGQVSVWPALAACGLDVAAAAGFARLWARDKASVVAEVRRAADGAVSGGIPPQVDGELGRALRLFRERWDGLAGQVRTEEAIVETLPDPLIVIGPDRAVLRANAAANAAYGSEISAVLRHPGLRGALDRVFASGAAQGADLSLPVPVPREVHATVFRLGGGRVAAVLSDRTRERALERMRADFVANASHELRTPLASLIGFIDTLRGPAADDPPAQARFLAIMAEQAGRMNRLIDDLLSLSRIELTEAPGAHGCGVDGGPAALHRRLLRAADHHAGHPPGAASAAGPAGRARRRGPVGPGPAEPAGQRRPNTGGRAAV